MCSCKVKISINTNFIDLFNCISELITYFHQLPDYSAVLINLPVDIRNPLFESASITHILLHIIEYGKYENNCFNLLPSTRMPAH